MRDPRPVKLPRRGVVILVRNRQFGAVIGTRDRRSAVEYLAGAERKLPCSVAAALGKAILGNAILVKAVLVKAVLETVALGKSA
jgi:hypothetical protein